MKTTTSVLLLLLFFPMIAFSQGKNFWNSDVPKPTTTEILDYYTEVSEYGAMGLELTNFKNHIAEAPFRGNGANSSIIMEFPDEMGNFHSFKMFRTTTMSPELAEKFPSISSYIGINSDQGLSIRLTITNRGIFGMISGGNNMIFINPMTNSGTIYKVFNRKNATRSMQVMQCQVANTQPLPANETQQRSVDDSTLRTYMLAVATTGEYSQFHIAEAGVENGTDAEKKAAVLAAIVVTMDRVNGVYERALSLTMQLVPNEEDIIFLDPDTDNLNNNNTGILINQSQTVIDNIIGFANYDIGHTFSTGAGGLAQLRSPCTGNKARGVTGIAAPVGDAYSIDYVAHEMGHQFGANHTFNNACGGNRHSPTAVEPGSGITIMGYAGICIPNIANNSIPVFHSVSISEMYVNITFGTGSGCDQETDISNTAPTVAPVSDYTIPYGTAFLLTAEATDAEGDELTYSWDQTDNSIAPMPPEPTSTQGPNFRSFMPDTSPSRYFPDLNNILIGDLAPTWQVIPTVARTMDFTLSVRDNNALGGQHSTEDFTITFANTGPFVVTSQNEGGNSYDQNEQVTVTWDVAGTTGNGINASEVDIYLSYFLGMEFPVSLATNVPNDGSHTVTIPIGDSSTLCKLMVKGSDNIFLDINDTFFTITDDVVTAVDEFTETSFSIFPNPNNGKFTLSFDAGITGKLKAAIYDIRGRLISTHSVDASNNKMSIDMHRPQTGIYLLQVSNGDRKITKKLIVN